MKLSSSRYSVILLTALAALAAMSATACSAETDDTSSGESEVKSAKGSKLEGVFAKDWSAASTATFLRVGGENIEIDLATKKLTKSFVFGATAALQGSYKTVEGHKVFEVTKADVSSAETHEFVGTTRGESSGGDFAPTDTFFLEINDAGDKYKLDLSTNGLINSFTPGPAKVVGTFGKGDVFVVEQLSYDAASTPSAGGGDWGGGGA